VQHYLRGRAAPRKQSGDDDVRVEDSAHSAAASPRLVLRLDGKLDGGFLAKIVPLP
jgi:hypothetical protein